jgi:hypothetical protein
MNILKIYLWIVIKFMIFINPIDINGQFSIEYSTGINVYDDYLSNRHNIGLQFYIIKKEQQSSGPFINTEFGYQYLISRNIKSLKIPLDATLYFGYKKKNTSIMAGYRYENISYETNFIDIPMGFGYCFNKSIRSMVIALTQEYKIRNNINLFIRPMLGISRQYDQKRISYTSSQNEPCEVRKEIIWGAVFGIKTNIFK